MFKGTLHSFPDWGTLSSGPGLLFLLYLSSPQVPPDIEKTMGGLSYVTAESRLHYSRNGRFHETKGVRIPGPHSNLPLLHGFSKQGWGQGGEQLLRSCWGPSLISSESIADGKL